MLMSIATTVCFSFGACSNEDDPVAAARETAAEIPANVPGDAKTGRIPQKATTPSSTKTSSSSSGTRPLGSASFTIKKLPKRGFFLQYIWDVGVFFLSLQRIKSR
jgi:hypothetical protein